jgi:hypothetical protein
MGITHRLVNLYIPFLPSLLTLLKLIAIALQSLVWGRPSGPVTRPISTAWNYKMFSILFGWMRNSKYPIYVQYHCIQHRYDYSAADCGFIPRTSFKIDLTQNVRSLIYLYCFISSVTFSREFIIFNGKSNIWFKFKIRMSSSPPYTKL